MSITANIIGQFAPIGLEEMSGIKLMNRIDTKFVTTVPLVVRLLKMAQADYRMQEIDGLRNMTYRTVYFDTPALDMFIAHHNGHAGRQKVRIRTYVDSHMDFLEVKTKNNHGRTRKKRIAVTDDNLSEPGKTAFLNQHLRYDPGTLAPRLQNRPRWPSWSSSATACNRRPCWTCCASYASCPWGSASIASAHCSPTHRSSATASKSGFTPWSASRAALFSHSINLKQQQLIMNTDFFTLLAQFFTTGNFGRITLSTFLINVVFVWIIIHFLYFRRSHRRDFYFTFMLLGITIYFLVYFMIYVLEDLKGKTGIGIGIGLFGIFSIMRYRTDTMPVREMTYLFVVVCLSVVHAMADSLGIDDNGKVLGTPIMELVVIDIITIAFIIVCERMLKVETSKLVQYDRIELIKPERREELVKDLEDRMGIKVLGVKVGAVDFLRDMAVLRVYYDGKGDNEVDNKLKIRNSEYEVV